MNNPTTKVTPATTYERNTLKQTVLQSQESDKMKAMLLLTIGSASQKQIDLRSMKLTPSTQDDVFMDMACHDEPITTKKEQQIFNEYLTNLGVDTALLN